MLKVCHFKRIEILTVKKNDGLKCNHESMMKTNDGIPLMMELRMKVSVFLVLLLAKNSGKKNNTVA